MTKIYHALTITADAAATEIWVGDADGHLVQKETGVVRTRLLPGKYSIQFGLKSDKRWIKLDTDREVRESM